ncbi:MAG: hypothetical protein E6J71_00450 [Deltaproteobacteria bacterium]|nr:MAG: hypothetical protein E6J81_06070 [Deltaproteobacteria bacterium]TMA94694.1 MAG: hypothetical protein E6J77_03165 [Deltaproteobacteria bacterium]TMB24856.1 MAG: hypothetical protein E6J71_00450 [Deltaproteobacteria bacterium]
MASRSRVCSFWRLGVLGRLSPSEDLALVAQRFAHRMPRMVRVPPRRLRGDRLASLPRDTRNKARYETGDPIHVVDARAPASGVRA